jgi:hypothetical protein
MKATIMLEIVFDEHKAASPEAWDWNELLDLGTGESVTVVSYEEEYE